MDLKNYRTFKINLKNLSFFSSQTVLYMYATQGVIMPTKSSLPHWNYMDRIMHPTIDFTDLDRLPTDTNDPVLNALNAKVNAQSERLELLFIEIECDRIDREEAQKEAPKKRTKRKSKKDLFEGIDEATKAELLSEGFELE